MAKAKSAANDNLEYSPDLAAKICDAIATSRGGLAQILKDNGINITTRSVYKWMVKHEGFRVAYEKAREYQAEIFLEEILDIANDDTNDTIPNPNGGLSPNPAAVQRARVKIDVRKFAMSKLYPKRYGEAVESKVAEQDALIKTLLTQLEEVKVKLNAKSS